MFGGSYSQFLETGTDPGKFRPPGYQNSFNQAPLNNFTFKIDMCDNQEDVIFGKNFIKMSYPIDFAMVNPFCPICGKFVAENDRHLTYQSKNFGKKFLAHEDCLNKQQSASFLSAAYDEDEQAKIIPFGLKKDQKSMPIGGQQFYLQMKITHPLSDFTFTKLSSKISAISNTLTWQLHRDQQSDCYLPNIICFPLSDFKLAITLTSMTTGQKTTNKSYINLGRLKYNEIKVITAKTEDIQVQMKIYYDLQQKEKITDEMNYKYKYSLKLPLPIVELVTIETKVPQEDQQSENQNVNQSKSAIQEIINEGTSYSSTIKTISFHNTNRQQSNSMYGSDILSEKSYDKEKIDLERLISNDVLGVYVRNNTQSRQFQNFLNQASQTQVDQIIKTLYMQLPDLIMHEYANYMVQKLFSVCNFNQRLKIMQRIHQQICPIVRNKQGTHTIQALIKLFTNDEQYGLMCQSIKSNFLQLSIHPNATHFIQKIITLFPIQHTFQFYDFATKNFLLFALDKNGMCVIKHMMIRISQIQSKQNSQKTKQLTNEAKKHFINQVTFNIDRIIQDAFGNYIIQFCYDYFGEDKCSGITQMIIERFPQFSLQKYSSSVVFKCISSFWNQKDSFNRLKQSLSGDAIVQMYRSRDGNKILLEIMQRHDNSSIRDKIYNQLVMGQPTKFNHDRWGVVLGIRSGTVGTQWTSFSDAVKKTSPFKAKKKHYN